VWYDATYVVFALRSIGFEKSTCCQPLGVSLVNVALASRTPALE
jgi:hypothetical protein